MESIDPPTLVCTEAGVFAWPGYVLVKRYGVRFIRASEREIGNHIGSLCGASVIYGPLILAFDRAASGVSPDRLDALVWAVTELMANRGAAILDYYRRLSEGGALSTAGQN